MSIHELHLLTSRSLRDQEVQRLVDEAAQLSSTGQRDVEEAVERAVNRLAEEGTSQAHINEVKQDLYFAMLSALAGEDRDNLRAALELRNSGNLVAATRWLVIATAGLVLLTGVLAVITLVKS